MRVRAFSDVRQFQSLSFTFSLSFNPINYLVRVVSRRCAGAAVTLLIAAVAAMDVSTGWRPPTHQPVTTPSVMSRILTFADKSTLAVCLRVNSIMFELAGRILYRHLDLVPLGNLPGLIFPALKGYQVEERERNRSGLRKTNFKGRLLEYTRRLSIDVTGARGLTHEPPIGVLVPNCATLLISGCGADCRHPHQCKIYGRFKVDDLILRHHDDDYHNHLGTMVALDPPKRVTITYHLDTFKSYYHHWRNGSFHTPVKLERLDILFDTITLLNRPSVRIRIFGWDSTCELTEIAVDHVLNYASQVVDTPVTLVTSMPGVLYQLPSTGILFHISSLASKIDSARPRSARRMGRGTRRHSSIGSTLQKYNICRSRNLLRGMSGKECLACFKLGRAE